LTAFSISDAIRRPPTQERRTITAKGMRKTAIARPIEKEKLSRIASTCSTKAQIPAPKLRSHRIMLTAKADPSRFSTAETGAMIRSGTDAKAKVERRPLNGPRPQSRRATSDKEEDAGLQEQSQRAQHQCRAEEKGGCGDGL
jgi:hypothetical protein